LSKNVTENEREMKLLNLYVIVSPVGRRVGGKLYAKQKLPIYFVNRLYWRVVIYLRSARVSAKRSREIAEGATAVSSPGHGNPHTNSSGSTVPRQAVKGLESP
jgi:hypothetical protein